MNRLRLGLVALVALVVAASCSAIDPPAVTVGDWSISQNDFIAQLDALEASPQLASSFGIAAAAAPPVAGTTTTAPEIRTASTAALANLHVQIQLMTVLATDLGIAEPSEADIDAARGQFEAQLQEQPPADLDPLLDEVGLALAYQGLIEAELLGDFDASTEARATYDQAVDSGALPEQSCIDVIVAAPEIVTDPATGQPVTPDPDELATSRAKADDLLARLEGGADFTELATAESDDQQTAAAGGDLGCFQEGGLNPTIEEPVLATEVGAITDVVDFGSGYAILRVRSRDVVPYEDVEQELVAQVQQQKQTEVVGGAIQARITELEVTVDPMFGRWDASTGEVLTPEGAEPPPVTVLAPADVDAPAP